MQQYGQRNSLDAVSDPALGAGFIDFEGFDDIEKSAWNYKATDADDAIATALSN